MPSGLGGVEDEARPRVDDVADHFGELPDREVLAGSDVAGQAPARRGQAAAVGLPGKPLRLLGLRRTFCISASRHTAAKRHDRGGCDVNGPIIPILTAFAWVADHRLRGGLRAPRDRPLAPLAQDDSPGTMLAPKQHRPCCNCEARRAEAIPRRLEGPL